MNAAARIRRPAKKQDDHGQHDEARQHRDVADQRADVRGIVQAGRALTREPAAQLLVVAPEPNPADVSTTCVSSTPSADRAGQQAEVAAERCEREGHGGATTVEPLRDMLGAGRPVAASRTGIEDGCDTGAPSGPCGHRHRRFMYRAARVPSPCFPSQSARGNRSYRPMPLLVLILIATTAGLLAAAVAWRYPRSLPGAARPSRWPRPSATWRRSTAGCGRSLTAPPRPGRGHRARADDRARGGDPRRPA